MDIFIAIPRFALSGGNLVSLDLANYLSEQGFNVYCLSGFKIRKANEVVLIKPKRGKLNSILNLFAFFNTSVMSLFLRNFVATHHLTSMFNCIKKCKFALVQDIEIDFYPKKLKPFGQFFWEQYLKSKRLIITNNTLAKRINYKYSDCVKGFSFIPFEFDNHDCNSKQNGVLAVVRDGSYKAPLRTIQIMSEIDGVEYVIVNATRNEITNGKVISNVDRKSFVKLLNKTKIFVCLSKWEGLGLPNIEAYVAGCHVISTPIPSAEILREIDPQAITIINDDLSNDTVREIIYENLESKNTNISLEEKKLRMSNLLKSRNEWLEYSKKIVIEGVNE